MTPKTAYNMVKVLAKDAGKSITQYCVDCGVSPGTVSKWKKAESTNLQLDTLKKLGIKL